MLISSEECQLVFLDVQEGALERVSEAQTLLARAQLLARAARSLHIPMSCTEQYPKLWGHMPPALQTLCPKPLPPCVVNGTIVFPEKSYSDKKDLTGTDIVPHQIGVPTKMTS